MGAILALILPFVPTLIQAAEVVFPTAKSGLDKAAAVLASVRGIVTQAQAANAPLADGSTAKAATITDDALRGAIEAEFQRLKTAGQLTAQQAGSYYLVQGTVTTLKVG